MPRWPWIERHFTFDYPPTKWPDLLERLRGTPARIRHRLAGLSSDALTRSDAQGWTIQENIGHLLLVEGLAWQRLEQILAGESELVAADMSNRRTNETDFNAQPIETLLATFETERARLVARMEQLDEDDWGRAARHPRLKQPMRIVDIACFHSEHDDYHLARIGELVRKLS